LPIQVPALYIHGRNDGCIGAEMVPGMENMFAAGLSVKMVEGAGHFVHQEKPDVVNAAVLKFLKGR
jgi:pimeloyl-ACP methyl ester carboxylesterase